MAAPVGAGRTARAALGAGPGPHAAVPREAFLRCLGRLADEAARRGVRLALKPHGGGQAGTGPALAETVRVLEATNVDVFYEPGNVRFYERLDPCRDVLPVARPGDGEVGCLQPLRAAGFVGPLLVECCAAADGDGVAPELRVVRRRLQEWWRLARPDGRSPEKVGPAGVGGAGGAG